MADRKTECTLDGFTFITDEYSRVAFMLMLMMGGLNLLVDLFNLWVVPIGDLFTVFLFADWSIVLAVNIENYNSDSDKYWHRRIAMLFLRTGLMEIFRIYVINKSY